MQIQATFGWWFEMQFQLDFYRRTSVWTPLPLKQDLECLPKMRHTVTVSKPESGESAQPFLCTSITDFVGCHRECLCQDLACSLNKASEP